MLKTKLYVSWCLFIEIANFSLEMFENFVIDRQSVVGRRRLTSGVR
jgi:hypothetical protein